MSIETFSLPPTKNLWYVPAGVEYHKVLTFIPNEYGCVDALFAYKMSLSPLPPYKPAAGRPIAPLVVYIIPLTSNFVLGVVIFYQRPCLIGYTQKKNIYFRK